MTPLSEQDQEKLKHQRREAAVQLLHDVHASNFKMAWRYRKNCLNESQRMALDLFSVRLRWGADQAIGVLVSERARELGIKLDAIAKKHNWTTASGLLNALNRQSTPERRKKAVLDTPSLEGIDVTPYVEMRIAYRHVTSWIQTRIIEDNLEVPPEKVRLLPPREFEFLVRAFMHPVAESSTEELFGRISPLIKSAFPECGEKWFRSIFTKWKAAFALAVSEPIPHG